MRNFEAHNHSAHTFIDGMVNRECPAELGTPLQNLPSSSQQHCCIATDDITRSAIQSRVSEGLRAVERTSTATERPMTSLALQYSVPC